MNSSPEDIKAQAPIAAELAKRYNDAYFVFDTPYGAHTADVSFLDSPTQGTMVLAVLPNGDIMSLTEG
jgi:hypothetical protein